MATLDVVSVENRKKGSVELPAAVFEAKVKPDLLHAEVRRQLAARHAGTHSTKNRAAVAGGGSKPWRQKGTGRARQGTIRAPQWAGGGAVFGPVPRSYDHSLPKKVRRAALRCALSLRREEGAITVVEALELEEPKTRRIVAVLEALDLADRGVLIVIAEADENVEKATRNLSRVSTIRAAGLNVYDVLRHEHLLFTQAALEAVSARAGQGGGKEAA